MAQGPWSLIWLVSLLKRWGSHSNSVFRASNVTLGNKLPFPATQMHMYSMLITDKFWFNFVYKLNVKISETHTERQKNRPTLYIQTYKHLLFYIKILTNFGSKLPYNCGINLSIFVFLSWSLCLCFFLLCWTINVLKTWTRSLY